MVAAEIVHLVKMPNFYPTPTQYMDLASGIIRVYGLSSAIPLSLVKKIFVDRINAAYHGKSKIKRVVALPIDQDCDLNTGDDKQAMENLTSTFAKRRLFIKKSFATLGVTDILAKYPFLSHPRWVRVSIVIIIWLIFFNHMT